jgi:serine/threonine protein kinase
MADRTGQKLGNYLLTGSLGRGGFAEVYLGQHVYLKTQAAIKVLMTQLSGEDDTESFLNEARTVAGLVHPNIVRVLEFGIDDKTPFLVMDYAPNGTIRQRYPRKTRVEPSIIVSYVKQIAAGLQYAHDQKLIHRDIKPENLLIGRHNEILLSDFGIALVAQSSRYQSTQDVVGTVAYMSPEQIQGKPRASSDQYALGIVVYELLSGDRPFSGSFTELCTQHMFAPPPPLRERVPTISLELEQVVNTALAKDPKQRFATVQAFANALEQASRDVPIIQKTPFQSMPSMLPPTVSAASAQVPPPFVSTQLASMATPVSMPSQTDNIPTPPPPPLYTPAPKQGAAKATRQRGRMNPWIALLVSTILFTLCDYGLGTWASGNQGLYVPIIPAISGYFSSYFTPNTVIFDLIITIPLFFAVEGGPWVGLVSVVVGNVLGDYIVAHQLYGVFWYYYVANALQVCIPGFALARTRDAQNMQKISSVLLWTAIGIGVASLIAVIGDAIVNHFSASDGFAAFLGLVLPGVVCLIILPILIAVYGAIARKRTA